MMHTAFHTNTATSIACTVSGTSTDCSDVMPALTIANETISPTPWWARGLPSQRLCTFLCGLQRYPDVRRIFTVAFYLCLLNFIGLLEAASASSHYVWCGATGANNGTEWTDAYTGLPTTLTRGDTYYVAGSNSCTYGPHVFNDALSGTSVISILHATSAANSGVAGWQASFGTVPAKWITTFVYGGTNMFYVFQQGYYTLDGQFGTANNAGTFGFWFQKAGDNVNFIDIDRSANAVDISNITINHVEMDGVAIVYANITTSAAQAIFAQPSGSHTLSNVTLQNNYMHDIETGYLQVHQISNWTIDHNWFARSLSTPASHGNGAAINPGVGETSSNLTFSNDTWEDVCGTSVITAMNGTVSNLVIYGNVFFQTGMIIKGMPSFCESNGTIGDLGPGNAVVNRAQIMHNTFYNVAASGTTGVMIYNPRSTNIVQQNNLFFNAMYASLTTGGTGDSEDHNTAINTFSSSSWLCSGAGDSCSPSSALNISSASITSNVADVTTTTAHGLNVGDPVGVIGTQANSTSWCGIDTNYPYPTVSQVVSTTEFKYSITAANAKCQAGMGYVFKNTATIPFISPSGKNFELASDTADLHLEDGTTLSAPYNIDPNGNMRGSHGTPARGAYESVVVNSNPPTGLSVTVHNP